VHILATNKESITKVMYLYTYIYIERERERGGEREREREGGRYFNISHITAAVHLYTQSKNRFASRSPT
jgi:hypothetical protein